MNIIQTLSTGVTLALTVCAVSGAVIGNPGGGASLNPTNSPSGGANYLRNDGTNYFYGSATAEATNAINNSVGRGTNTTINGLTNIGHVINQSWTLSSGINTNSGPTTFSSGVTNSGIVHVTGGATYTAGVTNTGHQRNTGWVENSGPVTNTGPVTFSSGVTNSGTVRQTGGITQTGGTTNSGHLRLTGWGESSAGLTNQGSTATHQAAPLLISGGFVFAPTTNASLAINQATNAYALYVTNADLAFTFTGTAPNGARGQVDIVNTAATNIIVTWPVSYNVAQGASVTTFTAISNSITEVFWHNLGGSNRIRVASKEIVENFNSPQAGQVVAFHDVNTRTNITIAGTGDVTASANFATDNVVIRSDGTAKGVQSSGITLDDSNNINTPAGVRGVTAVITNTLSVGGNVTATNTDIGAIKVTNNVTYVTANINPTGNSTQFQGDYVFGWRTYLMTNHCHVTGMVNVAAADLGRPWLLKMRNLSGGALVASVDSGFRRSGTNFVSVGNNQNADIVITPDGTGGVNPTNHTAQIIIYNSP